ncbi:hypothetical protein AWT69_002931 [Pseudomonas putida]|nr:hypothetical protein AWT69_002931 [Pseudomonas putida]
MADRLATALDDGGWKVWLVLAARHRRVPCAGSWKAVRCGRDAALP